MASSGTTSTRKRFTGAEFIVHFLEQQGIKIVTGIPGGSILPVYDALSKARKSAIFWPVMNRARDLSLRGWRAPTVNRRSVWPVADRVRLTW